MINSLQSIRFLLALMIFIHHFVLPPYNPFGDFPVAFFFILSGYVMTLGYQKKILSSGFNYRDFLCKRIIKVYPLHFIMMVIALVPIIISAIIHLDITCLLNILYSIPAFFLVQSWIPDFNYTYAGNPVSWFLSSMFFCYVMAPFVIRMITLHTKKAILFLTIVLSVYFMVISVVTGRMLGFFVYIFPLTRIIDFSIGVLLYQMMKFFSFEWLQNICIARKTLLEALSILLVVVSMILGGIVLPRYELASIYWIPSIFVIFVFAMFGNRGGYISKMLNKRWMSSLGAYSFPIYMIHYIAIRYYRPLITHFGFGSNNLVWIALGAVILTLLAYVYVNKVEPIIQRVLV